MCITSSFFKIPSFSMRAFALEGIMQDEAALQELTLTETDDPRDRLTVLRDFIDEIEDDAGANVNTQEELAWVENRANDLRAQAVRNYIAGRLSTKYKEL